jgi:Tol biopolymer transport system component
MDVSGNNVKQLTNGAGEALQQVTPDGRSVVYFEITSKSLSKVSIDGGEPARITDNVDSRPFVSRDGKLIAFVRVTPNATTKIAIVSSEDGALVKSFDAPGNADSRQMIWTPDGRALVYIDLRGGISNLWMLPVDGSAPTQLTDFRADRIYAFDFSQDGKWVAMSRGNSTNDVVLFSNVK